MTRDLFLRAHEQRKHIFNISSRLRPGSIRDQIIRGSLLASRAFQRGIINKHDAPMLIVGGGVAGAACALVAARLGVRTTLIEIENRLFDRLRQSTKRRVEPTFYDWPALHWDRGEYPWRGESSVLSMIPMSAAELTTAWEAELTREETRGLLRVLTNTTVDGVPQRSGRKFRVRIVTRGPTLEREELRAGAVVLATGPGPERDLHSTEGLCPFLFWEDDPLSDEEIGCDEVLISGGGDGALQDLLRAVFRPNVYFSHLVTQLELDEYERDLQHANDHATAAFLWWGSARDTHDSESFLHAEVEAIGDRIWRERREAVAQRFEENRRATLPKIVLAHRCDHFHRSYVINRLLAGLVLRWASEEFPGKITHHRGTKLVTPVPCRHPLECERTAKSCAGKPHKVVCYEATCLTSTPTATVYESETCDLVLVRHGVVDDHAFPELFRNERRLLHQLLPAHLAHDALLQTL